MILYDLIKKIKDSQEFSKSGMILTHTGIVRESTREGEKIKALEIEPDFNVVKAILTESKKLPGVKAIEIWIHEKARLNIGDEVMHIVIAGDIRENTLNAMKITLDEIKKRAVYKKHIF